MVASISARARRVGPAHAGMVRRLTNPACTRSCRPRARGDGPSEGGFRDPSNVSAPRTRGWSACRVTRATQRRVGPAHAGMVQPTSAYASRRNGRPRARGDGPLVNLTPHPVRMSAPRTRGWSLAAGMATGESLVGPAHAGMVLYASRPGQGLGRRPRARGDGPSERSWTFVVSSSAPRTRGWSVTAAWICWVCEVGPAHAGMVPMCSATPRNIDRRPRARGDGPAPDQHSSVGMGSAPRTRGWSHRCGDILIPHRRALRWSSPSTCSCPSPTTRTEQWCHGTSSPSLCGLLADHSCHRDRGGRAGSVVVDETRSHDPHAGNSVPLGDRVFEVGISYNAALLAHILGARACLLGRHPTRARRRHAAAGCG